MLAHFQAILLSFTCMLATFCLSSLSTMDVILTRNRKKSSEYVYMINTCNMGTITIDRMNQMCASKCIFYAVFYKKKNNT